MDFPYQKNYNHLLLNVSFVNNQEIVSEGWNSCITSNDCTAHAEIVALRKICKTKKNYRLGQGFSIYVTLEPCSMCLGALIHGRIDSIIYGASDQKTGCLGGKINLLNHRYLF